MPQQTVTLSKIPTGMCAAGWHEGTRAKDFRGTPVQVCLLWQSCPCQCHATITKMYADAELPRQIVENPEYVRPERTWYMPVAGIDYALESSASLVAPITVDEEEDVTPALPATRAREFAATPTGRNAHGQLETYVLEVVTEWLIEHDELCTPKFISEEIARVQRVSAPSVGAIGAVFDRWVKYGFANCSRKPVQFLSLTEEGSKVGLDAMKVAYKRRSR